MWNCQVWALDVKRSVYVRDGVLPEFPCGKSWKHIPGIDAMTAFCLVDPLLLLFAECYYFNNHFSVFPLLSHGFQKLFKKTNAVQFTFSGI